MDAAVVPDDEVTGNRVSNNGPPDTEAIHVAPSRVIREGVVIGRMEEEAVLEVAVGSVVAEVAFVPLYIDYPVNLGIPKLAPIALARFSYSTQPDDANPNAARVFF